MKSALWTSVMSALAVAGLFTACDKNNPEPTPGGTDEPGETVTWPKAAEGIANQYQYNSADLVDVKSVVYDYSEEGANYIFVFSTVEGGASVEEVLKTDTKAVTLVVPTVSGAVDTTKTFALMLGEGKELKVLYNELSGKEHSVKISANLKDESHAAVSVEYVGETPESPYFFLKYDGEVVKEAHEVVLENQMMREDGTITDIKSVRAGISHSTFGSQTALYFYDTEVDADADAAPVLVVAFPEDTEDIDFSTIDQGFLVQAGKDFEYSYNPSEPVAASGNFSIKENEAEGTFSVSLDLTVGDKSVALDYEGGAYVYFASMNSLEIDFSDAELNPDVNVLFREIKDGKCRLVFGSNEDAKTPEDLKEGQYAISVTVPSDGLDDEYELSEATDCVVEVYDYQNFTTTVYDGEHLGKDGVIAVFTDPNKDGKNLFIHLEELEFANGLYIDGSYYGAVTDAEIPDLTPVKPVEPKILITKADGTVLQDIPVTALEVAHFKDQYDPVGQRYSGYIFYFRNASTPAKVTKEDPTTPCFIIEDALLGCENLDLTTSDLKWTYLFFKNTNLTLAWTGYGYVVDDNYGFTYYRCPDKANLTCKKDGKEWYFKFTMTDYGKIYPSNYWREPEPNGTNNLITIEYKGPATKCTGTDFTNDLTDQDY